MNKKIKVLVISYLAWRDDTNVGNTFSNLFQGMYDKLEFASIYFKNDPPDNTFTKINFYISEMELAKSIITRAKTGKCASERMNQNITQSNIYNKARQIRWESLLLVQDCIGLLGNWKSKQLDNFVKDFNADIIFGPLGRVPVANNVIIYLHQKFNIPVITYAWDDHYSLHKKSLSLFFWCKTFLERKYIKKCADISSIIYTITDEMKTEYSKYFRKECSLLYKCHNFEGKAPVKSTISYPICLVYMGNIGCGRWKVLSELVAVLKKINKSGIYAKLYIFTLSPKSKTIEHALNVKGISCIRNPVPSDKIMDIMRSADILVHVEPRKNKERQFFRLSFSTKIVDYFYNARCILALGGETSTMRYLKQHNAAIVETNPKNVEQQLLALVNNPQKIIEFGNKSWECGLKYHQRSLIQQKIYDDFLRVINHNNKNQNYL